MTSARGVCSSDRSGRVSATASRHAPATMRPRPATAAMKPRSGNGRNCRVTRSITSWTPPPGRKSCVTWRTAWADPRASRSIPTKISSRQRFTPIPGWSQRRNRILAIKPTKRRSRPLELAMEDRDRLVAGVAQPLREILAEDDGPVPAAGAADADRELALALGLEGRDRELQQALDVVEVLLGARLGQHEVPDLARQARVLAELGDVIGVLEE